MTTKDRVLEAFGTDSERVQEAAAKLADGAGELIGLMHDGDGTGGETRVGYVLIALGCRFASIEPGTPMRAPLMRFKL